MADYRARGLTNGFLPEAAFLHLAPTATGFVDLDEPLAIQRPEPASWTPQCRDALLMVRLHEEPLAIIHVDGPLDRLTPKALAAVIWHKLSGEIGQHCDRVGCRHRPNDARDLIEGLPPVGGACPAARVENADASVTVVVPTGGRTRKLHRCLDAMSRLSFRRFEIVVVDNRPAVPGTRQVVESVTDRLNVRYLAEPLPGSSVARNRGIREATSEFVAFADDDVVVDARWLSWLMHPFADPSVTAVAGMILPLALETESQKRLEQYAGFSKGVTPREYDLADHRAHDRVLYPYWGGIFGSGASMAFRREDLAAAGGLDPALGAGSLARSGADIEVFTAAILRGGRVVYQPRAVCWHEHTRDPMALRRQLFDYGVGFTAVLTKYLTTDARFLGAVGRSVPLALKKRRDQGAAAPARLPRELARVERRGMLRGPWMYARSRRWARRLKLDDVLRQD